MINDEKDNNHFIPFVALTETWLNSTVTDAQLSMPSYNVSRCDRTSRGGGVLLYSDESIPITESKSFCNGTCEALYCKFETIKTSIFTVYRPPNASRDCFMQVLRWIKQCMSETEDDYQSILLGDFNFPCIDWSSGLIGRSVPVDQQLSAGDLLDFISGLFFSQSVRKPTRLCNVLDLFFTNNPFLVTHVATMDTGLSDHKLVDINVSLSLTTNEKSPQSHEGFKKLDFSKANFDLLNTKLQEVQWDELFQCCPFEDFSCLFTLILLQLCEEVVRIKQYKKGNLMSSML